MSNLFDNISMHDHDPIEEAIQFLHKLCPISPELKEHFLAVLKFEEYPKGMLLLRTDHISNKVWYLSSGKTRWFHQEGNKEVTHWFVSAPNPILSAQSFYKQQPSRENIEAIETCLTIYMNYRELMDTYDRFPETRTMGRIVSDSYNEQIMEYARSMRQTKATDRYTFLQKNFPELIDNVHIPYLASFINMDVRTFYRIRNIKRK